MKAIRYISFLVLTIVYLAASSSTMVSQITPTYTGSGPAGFATDTGQAKDVPKKVIVQRRHIPLVKPLTIPVETGCFAEFPSNIPQHSLVHELAQSVSSSSYCTSSICDRAPPVA
jgi:hypothetical protein